METNYFEEENKLTRKLFDLEKIINFQLLHDVQIIRAEDYMYNCYIDKKPYSAELTPLFSMVNGIINFEKNI